MDPSIRRLGAEPSIPPGAVRRVGERRRERRGERDFARELGADEPEQSGAQDEAGARREAQPPRETRDDGETGSHIDVLG